MVKPRHTRPSAIVLAACLIAASVQPDRPNAPPALGDYLRAVVALQANDFSFAAEHMLRALAADPANRALRRQSFVAAALAGRPEASRVASGLPDDPTALMLLGNDAAIAGRWDEAQRQFASLPHDGALADALRPALIAWSLLGGGHPDAALQTLTPLIGGTRLPGFYALNAALIADLAGRSDEAASNYHLAQVGSPGLNLSLVRVLASFAARNGHAADATALVHALVAAAPSLAIAEPGIDAALSSRPIGNAREGLAEAYSDIASIMSAQSEAQEATAVHGSTGALLMLRFSETLDPASTTTRLMIADTDETLHDPTASLDALARLPASDALAPLVELRQAELQRVLGHADVARALLTRLSAAYPRQPLPARELGEMLSDDHRYQEADAAFDRAVADIERPTGDDWELFFDRAVSLDRSHQWNRAEADLQKALALSPEQPFVLNYLGYSYAEQGRNLDAARRMLERALDQKPHDGAFLDSLGWIILKQGQVENAVDTLQAAAETTPEDPTVNYHLGVAYWEAGRRMEAEDQWRRALILNPDPDDLPKIQARLREAALGQPPRGP